MLTAASCAELSTFTGERRRRDLCDLSIRRGVEHGGCATEVWLVGFTGGIGVLALCVAIIATDCYYTRQVSVSALAGRLSVNPVMESEEGVKVRAGRLGEINYVPRCWVNDVSHAGRALGAFLGGDPLSADGLEWAGGSQAAVVRLKA